MKKIKYLILFVISIGLFSCGDDDFSITYEDNEVKTDLIGSLTLNKSGAVPTTNMMEVTVTLPQVFDVESTVEVTVESSYGGLPSFAFSTIKSYIKIPAGSASVVGSIEMAGSIDDAAGDFLGIDDYATAWISGIALTQEQDGNDIDPYTMSSDKVSVTSYDYHDPYMESNDETLMMSLDWLGPYGSGENDLDLVVYDSMTFQTFETSFSGSRFEGDFFNNPANELHPDGNYVIEVSSWTTVSAEPVPFRLVLTHPDGSVDFYEDSIDPSVGFVSFLMTKITDADGNITFTTSN